MGNNKDIVHTASRRIQPTPKLVAPRAIMVSNPMDHPMDSNHQLVVCSFVVSSFGLLTYKCNVYILILLMLYSWL